jgi:2-polyprenyl-3-methyl-5-hydroxy-6-metoxy-1,4-benzoquinol methylase
MSKHIVARLLQVCGPCRILHAGAPSAALLEDLLLAGCDAYAFGPSIQPHPCWIGASDALPAGAPLDAMLVDISSVDDAAGQLSYFLGRFSTPRVLALRARGLDRRTIEKHLFETLWRRHPGDLPASEYEGLREEALGELRFYERVSFYERTQKAGLSAECYAQVDMLRESGGRADAHIARYSLAAQFVRPGDTVLDCASGLGYGTAILAALSSGRAFIGVAPDEATVEYARTNYGRDGVNFRTGNLKSIRDSSIDVIVSMDTLEHVPDWKAALKEFHRVLKPDGRLVASVPDRWTNAGHFQVFDWTKLENGLNQHFFVEMRYAQTAPGGFKLTGASHSLRPVDLDADIDTEWLIAVACKSPLEGQGRGDFKHPGFQASFEKSGAAVVDFAHTYDNPYLYRTMVQMGERIRHDLKLATLAHWVIMNARPDSADRGAAICVFGYQVLKKRELKLAAEVLAFISDYIRVTADERNNPHVLRWRVSLTFLAGRVCELMGDRDHAADWYHAVTDCQWYRFSPLLATKTVAACFFEGRIRLADGDLERAKACFAQGLAEALAAMKGDLNDIVGNPEQPIPFGLTELAEVIDMGSQCANAIAHSPLWKRDPGLFWKHVDIKRFGLASWAIELENENQNLRNKLAGQAVHSLPGVS